jgi:hypothetical protein
METREVIGDNDSTLRYLSAQSKKLTELIEMLNETMINKKLTDEFIGVNQNIRVCINDFRSQQKELFNRLDKLAATVL